MCKSNCFKLDQIKKAWAEYRTKKVLRVLKNGKWESRPVVMALKHVDGVRAQVVLIKDTMSFPEYLEQQVKDNG